MREHFTVEAFILNLDHPYAWPGGYPRYFVTSDGAVLSFEAAKGNREQIIDAISENSGNGWHVVGVDVNWENPELFCDHTGKRIESAYAEDEVNKEQAS